MTRRVFACLSLAAVVTACLDDQTVNPPTATAGGLFASYVALGNSITAGFQSGGIDSTTQAASYAVLLAEQMGTTFNVPWMRLPGCPPVLTDIFTLTRVGGASSTDCFLRTEVPEFLHLLAVPGAAAADLITGLRPENPLNTFILGGQSQVAAAANANPTFATVWIGNNDVLAAALSGDVSLITSGAAFTTSYGAMMSGLDAIPSLEGGVLLSVANVTAAPNLSLGAAFFQASMTPGALPPTLTVDASCAPSAFGGVGDSTLVPFAYGFGVLLARASAGIADTLNCATDAEVLSKAELIQVVAAVQGYNATIQAAATARGWLYVDVNVLLDSLVAAGEIPLFPNTASVTAPFGPWLSLDGVHPNSATHRLIARALIPAINAHYGSSIPQLP